MANNTSTKTIIPYPYSLQCREHRAADTEIEMKKIIGIYSAPRQHWVGDGFPVRSLFSYQSHGKALSPFLLLDRAGPVDFSPSASLRGVGQHPHRGFEK